MHHRKQKDPVQRMMPHPPCCWEQRAADELAAVM